MKYRRSHKEIEKYGNNREDILKNLMDVNFPELKKKQVTWVE